MKKTLLVVAATALTATAHANSFTKAGLWDMTIKMTYNKGGPKIAPEQLAQMRQMGFDPSNMQMQHCITPQQAQQDFDPTRFNEHDNNGCKVENQKISGNTFTGDYVCTGKLEGRGKVQGQGTGDSFNTTMTFVGTSHDAHMGNGEIDMRTDISGKFLGADCGSQAGGIPGMPKGFKMPNFKMPGQ